MKNVRSKLSLLTAFLCLAFTVQAQVSNPSNSTFEVNLTGDTDPQLVLKRAVTSPSGGGPTGGSTPPTTTTFEYHWQINAKAGGLHFQTLPYLVATSGVNALRLDDNGAYFYGSNLSLGSSLSADLDGLTISGDNLLVGNHLEIDNDQSIFRNEVLVVGRSITLNDGADNQFRVTPFGVVTARRVKVNMNSIPDLPDYVFEPDYDLMSIEELDAYIQEHGHLPNINSAQEYEEIGTVDLGELNIKLLEKVEELSLYTIDLQKQVKVLKEELENLKEEK